MVIASSTEAAATNVPVQATELIGREADLDRLSGRLDKNRLITLTGPGGIGKTRLGLEVARAALPKFADGVWVAELAAVTDAARPERRCGGDRTPIPNRRNLLRAAGAGLGRASAIAGARQLRTRDRCRSRA